MSTSPRSFHGSRQLRKGGHLVIPHSKHTVPTLAPLETGAMGKKDKAEKKVAAGDDDDDEGSTKQRLVSPIATPLAGKKLAKKALKTVKKAAKAKMIRRGVKEVVKALKKGDQGLVIIAGDISPIDVIAACSQCPGAAAAQPRAVGCEPFAARGLLTWADSPRSAGARPPAHVGKRGEP